MEDLDTLLREVAAGALRLAGRDVALRPLDANDGTPTFKDTAYEHAWAMIAQRLPVVSVALGPRELVGHALALRPSRATQSLTDFVEGGERALDRTLQALEHPWNGLGGLARVAVRSARDQTGTDSPLFEIVAPLGAAFEPDSVRLSAGTLTASVWVTSAVVAPACTVGYVAEREDGSFENGTARLTKRWRGRGERRASLSLSLRSAVRRATLLLRIGPHPVQRVVAVDRAPRARVPMWRRTR